MERERDQENKIPKDRQAQRITINRSGE